MHAGWRIAINSLSAKRGRSFLIILAVACAAGMVLTASITVGSISTSIRDILVDMLGRADVRLRHTTQGRIDEALIDDVLVWPEVEAFAPRLTANIEVTNVRNKQTDVFTGQGVSFDREWEFRPPEILDGRLPDNDSEVLIDPGVAGRIGARVGDELILGSWGKQQSCTVVGVQERMRLAILQTPEVRLDLKTLQELAGYEDRLTEIDVVLKSGCEVPVVIEAHGGSLPRFVELVPSDLILAGLDRLLRAGTLMEALTAMLCFLAAAFIILIGMTTAVTERWREIGMLRCIGARRIQIFWSQLCIGILLGSIGGLLGIPIGYAFALLIMKLYGKYIRGGLEFSVSGTVTVFLVALAAGVAGSLLPAIGASRVTPMQAVRVRSRMPRRRGLAIVTIIAALLLVLHQVFIQIPDNEQVVIWLYLILGGPMMIVGWFLMAVPVTRLIATIASRPLTWLFRLPAGHLLGTVQATPYRHGFTAGALMMGLAAMIATWSYGEGVINDWIGRIQFPGAFVHAWTGLDDDDLTYVRDQPWITNANPITYFKVPVTGQHLFGIKGIALERGNVVGFEPAAFFGMTNIEWAQGDEESAIRRLENDEYTMLVAREFLVARGIGVGDTLTLGPEDNLHEFEIVGVVSSPGLDIISSVFGIQGAVHEQAIHCVFMARSEAKRCFDNDDIVLIQFSVDPSVSDEEAKQRLAGHLGPAQFGSGRQIKKYIIEVTDGMMLLCGAIAFTVMIIASLGMANVIAANVAARRYEYGVLRACGSSRGLLVRLVLAEGILIAGGASIIGMGLGFNDAINAAFIARMMMGIEVAPVFPVVPVCIGMVGLFVLAMLAALPPAVRLAMASPRSLLGG